MPVKKEREYRTLVTPLTAQVASDKRINTECYVEGYATTFNVPYLLYEFEDGTKIYERIDAHALDNADMSDVIMQYDHTGRLYDTYNTERYRLAYINSNASVSELAKRLLGEIEITFMCKAYERRLNGDKTITLTKAATIYNTEGFTATPYIKITGSGGITLYINNRAHTFKDVNEYIEIDGEIMNAYKGDLLQNSKMVTELFPKLTAGANNISWAGNVTKVEIIPRWCRL